MTSAAAITSRFFIGSVSLLSYFFQIGHRTFITAATPRRLANDPALNDVFFGRVRLALS